MKKVKKSAAQGLTVEGKIAHNVITMKTTTVYRGQGSRWDIEQAANLVFFAAGDDALDVACGYAEISYAAANGREQEDAAATIIVGQVAQDARILAADVLGDLSYCEGEDYYAEQIRARGCDAAWSVDVAEGITLAILPDRIHRVVDLCQVDAHDGDLDHPERI